MIRSAALAMMALAACATKAESPAPAPPVSSAIAAAVEGAWRSPADKSRDVHRHPAETLAFFEAGPSQTIIEIAPGAGWYTEILAPYARMTRGRYIAAAGDPAKMSPQAKERTDQIRARFSDGTVYGDVSYVVFEKDAATTCAPGGADLVLTFRNVHNWIAGGWADKAFKDMATCLRPGGVLGVVEHRMPASRPMDEKASTGYVHVAAVRKLAADAGLVFEAESELNANAKDTADHPFGVWTLPPSRRGPAAGEAPPPGYDPAKYDAIGESDRMTLKFRKPR